MSPQSEANYWALVQYCLVKYFGFTPIKASEEIGSWIKELKTLGPDVYEIGFHDSEFTTACCLAHVPDIPTENTIKDKHWEDYKAARNRIWGVHETVVEE